MECGAGYSVALCSCVLLCVVVSWKDLSSLSTNPCLCFKRFVAVTTCILYVLIMSYYDMRSGIEIWGPFLLATVRRWMSCWRDVERPKPKVASVLGARLAKKCKRDAPSNPLRFSIFSCLLYGFGVLIFQIFRFLRHETHVSQKPNGLWKLAKVNTASVSSTARRPDMVCKTRKSKLCTTAVICIFAYFCGSLNGNGDLKI